MRIQTLTAAAVLVVAGIGGLHADLRLELRAGGHDRENCPVVFSLPDALKSAQDFRLVRESDQQSIPVQRFGGRQGPRIMWMIHDRLAAGETRSYKLSASDRRNQVDAVNCEDDGARLTLSVQGSPVLKFNYQTVESPEGIDPVYRRGGYLHPVFTPNGNIVTGDFERDHPHQHGVFLAWVNTTFHGQPTDFWNQAAGSGDVEFSRFLNRQISGPVFAQFTARLTHVAVVDRQRSPAIDETWLVRVYNSQKPFLFEIYSRQTAATQEPVYVNEYHYGGFAIRGPSGWLLEQAADGGQLGKTPAAGAFLTSEGRTREDGNHTRARWVEMNGPIGSETAGIIALSAPSNFRSPQPVRLHPNKPYFCFAPMVLGEFKIEPHETYASRYRLVVHDGEQDRELAERMWQDFAHPPRVRVLQD